MGKTGIPALREFMFNENIVSGDDGSMEKNGKSKGGRSSGCYEPMFHLFHTQGGQERPH